MFMCVTQMWCELKICDGGKKSDSCVEVGVIPAPVFGLLAILFPVALGGKSAVCRYTLRN